MRNIFLEKSYANCCGETIPSLFSKKSKLSLSLDQWCKVFVRQVEDYQNILKLSYRPLTFTLYKTFL